jgi:RNA polymerase sigma factor (sigma-70 family)
VEQSALIRRRERPGRVPSEGEYLDDATAGGTFEDFFHDHYGRLSQALLLITADPWEAEEVVQEAMARALERWDRVRSMESPVGYVYRVAVNLHRRRRHRRSFEIADPAREPGRDPADVVGSADAVLRALRALSPDQRTALVLVEWLGLDSEQAGRVLGIKAASVRARVHRARLALREQFGGDAGED